MERVFWAPRGGDNLKPRPLGNASVNQAPSGVRRGQLPADVQPEVCQVKGTLDSFHSSADSVSPSLPTSLHSFLSSLIYFLPSFLFFYFRQLAIESLLLPALFSVLEVEQYPRQPTPPALRRPVTRSVSLAEQGGA